MILDMHTRDAQLTYDGDILKSAVFKKGRQERPLWHRLERLNPNEMIIWSDRFDSLCSIACEWALAQAFENSYEVILPKRSQYVRTVLCEINRLIWNLTYLGRVVGALGQRTLLQHAFILREQVFTIQEELTGGRILPQALSIGGCRRELPLGNVQKIRNFVKEWSVHWLQWLELTSDDPLLMSRLKGLIPIDANLIEKLGWWGLAGKASGVSYDTRKHRPHGAYPFLDFEITTNASKDAWGRFEVAIGEIQLSLHLIEQIIRDIPGDPGERPPVKQLIRGFYSGAAESAKGPIISCVEVGENGLITTVRLFSSGQRVWPVIDHLFKDIRAEDFEVAFATLGIDSEDSEI